MTNENIQIEGDISPKQITIESDLFVPTYDESIQLSVNDLDVLYPNWQTDTSLTDPELMLFDVVRTAEERALGSERGVMSSLACEGIEKSIEQIPDEVGRRFQAHGIAGKYGSSSTELDSLLSVGIDPDRLLYTAELRYNPEIGGLIGADGPFSEGGLVVVGEMDKHVADSGIKYVIVGEQYLKVFDVMKSRFPDVNFIPWHDAPEYFCDLVNISEGSSYAPKHTDYSSSYEPAIDIGDTLNSSAHGILAPVIDINYVDDDSPDIW